MTTRILTVTTNYWTAQCRWVFRYGKWECVIMDKELNFLKGLDPAGAKFELEKLGAKWVWGKIENREPQVAT